MADPHNPLRAGEIWRQDRLDAQLIELEALKSLVVYSGGWAWHFMSPLGHKEVKTFHDHKDVDLFVKPVDFQKLLVVFRERDFERARTKYDDPSGDFYRYIKRVESGKIVLDVFVGDVPFVEASGYRVVEPNHLLSLYGVKHTSEECAAVQAARKLVAKGISPVGRKELVEAP